jgi:hypothetical protein
MLLIEEPVCWLMILNQGFCTKRLTALLGLKQTNTTRSQINRDNRLFKIGTHYKLAC